MRNPIVALAAAVLLLASCKPGGREAAEGDNVRAPGPAPSATATAAATPLAGATPEPLPAECAGREVEVVVWGLRQWQVLAEELDAHPNPCADYYISIPPVVCDGLKTCPRGPLAPEGIRALGPRFHAMAEFHWGSWRQWVEAVPGRTWTDAGKEFRRRMDESGYDVAAGDTWALNEFPSTVVSGEGPARANARIAVRALNLGAAGDLPTKGAIFNFGMGQRTTNFSVYEPRLKSFLKDRAFWEAMNANVRFWGHEVYTEPEKVCVAGSTVASRSRRVNEFVQHPARAAVAGPDAANAAQTYFGRAYTPLMNASWQQPLASGLGDTQIPLLQMQRFVSVQVYASRAWAGTHSYPDGRIGFAWAPPAGLSGEEVRPVATRLAMAIRDAYALEGGGAAKACSPTGSLTGCQCSVSGAAFNPGWNRFGNAW